jgi:molecular chaperone GrpE
VGGINLIYQKMKGALEADGVVPTGACGEAFDPNLHEAISQEPSVEFQSGQIVDVLQKGYMIGEKVLRPAIVRVAQ